MGARMLCTDCLATTHPDSVLPGSDLVEALFWLCGALPGWLLCSWRHAVRAKVCGCCGGASLVREARAAAARAPVAPPSIAGAGVRSRSGSSFWPPALRGPRERLRAGAGGALLFAAFAAACGVSGAAPCGPTAVLGVAWGAWLLAWTARVARLRAAAGCQAWDGEGRPLSIELI